MITEEAKKLRNEYIKEWRRKNKDKVKEYNHKHWNNKVERLVQERLEQIQQSESEDGNADTF